jgi:hypothetical protein
MIDPDRALCTALAVGSAQDPDGRLGLRWAAGQYIATWGRTYATGVTIGEALEVLTEKLLANWHMERTLDG